MHHFAFFSKDLDCWVVVHELAGTRQLAVDVECTFGGEATARRIAASMNADAGRSARAHAEDMALLGRTTT
jgi:hypothetical protein